jgi:hypothetical protein
MHEKTHISIILDRTGSMSTIRDDIIGGYNIFIKSQKSELDKTTVSLIQFDSHDPYEVIYRFVPIDEVAKLTRENYIPRATTPLLDAVGRGINDLEKSISNMKKSERPQKIIMVIITDGQENSSREFKKEQIEKMIKEKQEKEGWQFVFLSADLKAIHDAIDYGFKLYSVLNFKASIIGVREAFLTLSESLQTYKKGKSSDVDFSNNHNRK